jgi:hypothetical protein
LILKIVNGTNKNQNKSDHHLLPNTEVDILIGGGLVALIKIGCICKSRVKSQLLNLRRPTRPLVVAPSGYDKIGIGFSFKFK